MTKYTADDFKYADFAMHPITGSVASKGRMDWKWVVPGWYDTGDVSRLSDHQMADAGWAIVRNAESLTAREHLAAAWEKAHETNVIPAGAGYITKRGDGDFLATPEGARYEVPSRGAGWERRLLDPPPTRIRLHQMDCVCACQWEAAAHPDTAPSLAKRWEGDSE